MTIKISNMMTSHDKTKFKQYLHSNADLQKVLEGKHQSKEDEYIQENTGST